MSKGEGLRERKKRAMRLAIQRAAFELFLSKGYDQTTMDEIARAVDVSPGTVFNYFPTKEDLVVDDYDPIFIRLLEARPADEPPFLAVRNALDALYAELEDADRAFVVARARLCMSVPSLRAALALDMERNAALLAELLAKRLGRSHVDFELTVFGRLVVAAAAAAQEVWLAGGAVDDVRQMIGRALTMVESGTKMTGVLEAMPPAH